MPPPVHPGWRPVAARLGIGAVALRYAAIGDGLKVLQLIPGTKRPATEHGVNDATADPAVIDGWYARNRAAGVGLDRLAVL